MVTDNCLGFPVFTGSLGKLGFPQKTLITTINQYSLCIAQRDEQFKKALVHSDLLLPDGIGIVKAFKFLTGKEVKKFSGSDLHNLMLKRMDAISGKCFYLGSSDETLAKIRQRLSIEYPNISVGTFSPPYKPEFDEEDNKAMAEAVNAFEPDVLFVGMTAPKQEKWAAANKENLNANVICAIGAVFDFYAGTVERPSEFWVDNGMEWLGRFFSEPKRLWKRYLYFGFVFGYYLAREKTRLVLRKAPKNYRDMTMTAKFAKHETSH
ncbi:MAG: WecB/TagA/CpsF family glycosyltransferase [Leeuwenhoekiella sp.]